MIYCQALLPRSGLGNRLFPWARCRIFSYLHRVPMLSPQWAQVKIGHFIRGESDSRLYHNLFKTGPGQIHGWRKIWLEYASKTEPEPQNFQIPIETGRPNLRPRLIVFKGEGGHFLRLNRWNQFLNQEIRAVTQEQWLKKVDKTEMAPVGIHVRRGDFAHARSSKEFQSKGLLRTPIRWFIDCLRAIRDRLQFSVRAFVVSDGYDRELKELLALDNIFRVSCGSAIGDLSALSRAKILIASGGSTFSAWASFLGQMPTVSHPGQSLTWFKLTCSQDCYVGEFNPSSPPNLFLEQARTLLH